MQDEFALLFFVDVVPKRVSAGERCRILASSIERMSAEFVENGIAVAKLASLCGISEVYFRRLFLSRFGVSPKEHMIALRMGDAKQLLASADLSVNEVATACGYAEPSHFSREFSRRVGCAPTAYKCSGRE